MQITVTFDSINEMKDFTELVIVGAPKEKPEAQTAKNLELATPMAASVPVAPTQQPVTQVPVTPPPAVPTAAPSVQPAPVQATVPIQQPAPVQAPVTSPAMPAQQPVPTTAKAYTADELARAAMALMDSGRQGELIGLLKQFGVAAIPELKPEQLGAFATALRGMGAQI